MGRGYTSRKPNKRTWVFVESANAFFTPKPKLGSRNPPNKIALLQDKLARYGKETMVRKNLKTNKWELYKKRRGR